MSSKSILIITQYFYPENFKSNDIAFELTKRGHKVTVLCGIPNYPEGKYYKGYGLFKRRIENVSGVKVYRVAQSPRGSKSNLLLSLNYLSYALFASIWVLFLAIFHKYDKIFVHEPSPITQGFPAILMKKLQRIPLYFWVLDIWPDAMVSGGGVKSKRILNFMNNVVKYVYNKCDKILISSKGFKKSIMAKGEFEDKLVYFPNWSKDFSYKGENDVTSIQIPKGFKIMMAGNIGNSQDLPAVLNAALKLKDQKEIKWLFVGDGSMKEKAEEFVIDNDLSDNVFFYGKFPEKNMAWFYLQADIMLITLRSNFPHLKLVVPARLQSYMSAEKPIFGMIDGGAAEIIEEAKCGKSVRAGDSNSLAELILKTYMDQSDILLSMGNNARSFYKKNFTLEVCINNLCKIMEL